VAGGDAASLVAAIKTRERRRAEVVSALGVQARVRRMTDVELVGLRQDLQTRLEDWRGLLRRQPVQGRQILRKLLVGRLVFSPQPDRRYEFSGEGTLGRSWPGRLVLEGW
jgi:hypothetical protein